MAIDDLLDFLVFALLATRSPATVVVVSLGVLFALGGAALLRGRCSFLSAAFRLLPIGIAMSCVAYAALLLALSVGEPHGEARNWLLTFAQAAAGWGVVFAGASALTIRQLSVSITPRPRIGPILAVVSVFLSLALAVPYIATGGKGTW